MSTPPSRFEAALKVDFPDPLTPQAQAWFDYARTANERGRQCIEALKPFIRTLRGKRVLDIGAGHGGVCISAAQAGATCVGVENNPTTLALARENLADFPGLPVTLFPEDFFTWIERGDVGRFDLIVCDNVIEHAVFPERLILVLSWLLARDGVAYVTVPNAFSVGEVLADCHYGQFGLTLLDPYDGEAYLRQKTWVREYGVTDYFGWDYYRGKFEKYGFHVTALHPCPPLSEVSETLDAKLRQLEDGLAPLRADARLAEPLRRKIEARIEQYLMIARADLARAATIDDPRRRDAFEAILVRDYWIQLWYVVLHRTRHSAAPNDIVLPRDPRLLARHLVRRLAARAARLLRRSGPPA